MPRTGVRMTCPHPLTAIVRDSAGVEVCGACSPDVTSRRPDAGYAALDYLTYTT